ncbi:MAG: hypothetical protein ACRDO2_00250 [Nocardioidaceae bacterium]
MRNPTADRPTGSVWYEIRLQGHLDHRWATRFDGMTLTRSSDGTTRLLGPVVDQAALHGLLHQLRDIGLPLVSVNQVQAEETTPQDPSIQTSGD